VEHSQRNPFASLRLRTICGRAGYSTGAFYEHWTNLDDYQQALAEHLGAAAGEQDFIEDLASLADYAAAAGDTSALGRIVRTADRDFELLMASPLWDAMQLLNVAWGRTRFRQQMVEGYAILDHATGEAYGSALRAIGREPRPPFDWDRIGLVLQGLIEGLGMRAKVDPSAVSLPSEAGTGLYAIAAAAVLTVLTRQIGATATVDQTLQNLFDSPGSHAK
jgi:AcrR family transcriptional regulator